jgi:hypothetical protein
MLFAAVHCSIAVMVCCIGCGRLQPLSVATVLHPAQLEHFGAPRREIGGIKGTMDRCPLPTRFQTPIVVFFSVSD